MFPLALRTMKYDLYSMRVAGWMCMALFVAGTLLSPVPFSGGGAMFVWAAEVVMIWFMPVKQKMYFIMAMEEKDRSRLLVYRTVIAEMAIWLLMAVEMVLGMQVLHIADVHVYFFSMSVVYVLYESFAAAQFCSYGENISVSTKSAAVALGIVGIIFLFIVIVIAENAWQDFPLEKLTLSKKVKLISPVLGVDALFNGIKWYFAIRMKCDSSEEKRVLKWSRNNPGDSYGINGKTEDKSW